MLKKLLIFFTLLVATNSVFSENISYSVEFQALSDSTLLQNLQTTSSLVTLQNRPPLTLIALQRRAEADLLLLKKVLHAFGYYDGVVLFEIFEKESKKIVLLKVKTGPIYHIEQFEHAPEAIGKPATSALILNTEEKLLLELKNKGYPFPQISQRKVLVHSDRKKVSVTLQYETGPYLTFGKVNFIGLDKVHPRFLQKKITFKEGEPFSLSKIQETRQALEKSALFSSLTITYPSNNDLPSLPLTIALSERKQRTIGLGIGYTTHKGVAGLIEWEHRNILGRGEKLYFSTDLTEKKQTTAINYHKPDFFKTGQDLIWTAEGEQESAKTFFTQKYQLSAKLKRELNKQLVYSYGVKVEQQRTIRSDNDGHHTFVSLPLFFRYQNSDNPLDPKNGGVIKTNISPYSQINRSLSFLSNKLQARYYYPLRKDSKLLAIARITLASIAGASQNKIPPPYRFYGGSEQEFRGYGYKTVSPLNESRDPTGGRSMLLYSLEIDGRISSAVSVAAFFEMGNVAKSSLPAFDKKQLKSWGIGVRYHTLLGPLSLDLAFPIDRRKDLDNSYHIYLSIGPSF